MKCFRCGHGFDMWDPLDAEGGGPVPGDLVVCYACAAVSRMTPAGELVPVDDTELRSLLFNDDRLVTAMTDVMASSWGDGDGPD